MATYEIRPHGRTKDTFGYTLVTIEPNGTETPLMIFSDKRQAKEAVAVLQHEDWKRFKESRKNRHVTGR
jgi:hypothetical protein